MGDPSLHQRLYRLFSSYGFLRILYDYKINMIITTKTREQRITSISIEIVMTMEKSITHNLIPRNEPQLVDIL